VGSLNNYNGEESEIAIRGIQSSAGPQTTGIYLDDTPTQGRHIQFSTVNAFPALFDLERVEVLRGPQGTRRGNSEVAQH
jgi:iron complex outermembrane recepter protein